jgi:hypothetical protein
MPLLAHLPELFPLYIDLARLLHNPSRVNHAYHVRAMSALLRHRLILPLLVIFVILAVFIILV